MTKAEFIIRLARALPNEEPKAVAELAQELFKAQRASKFWKNQTRADVLRKIVRSHALSMGLTITEDLSYLQVVFSEPPKVLGSYSVPVPW